MADNILSLAQIETRFDAEWVLLEDPVLGEDGKVAGGKVIWHSKDRDEVYHKAVELRLKHSAFLYTGTMPEDTAIVL
jgi:hypothetical protein